MSELISREEARKKGLKNFFTGKPCIRGHFDYRATSNHTCWSCKRERLKNKQNLNQEKKQSELLENLRQLGITRKILSRTDALANGLDSYFNGKPCKKGHYEGFSVYTECCRKCVNTGARQRRNPKPRLKLPEKQLRDNRLKRLKEWRKRNPSTCRVHNSKRRARKLQALPKWTNTKELKAIYKNCPEGMHVDHIIPFTGKLVSGLHVVENLQYLKPLDNMEKFNKFTPYREVKGQIVEYYT